MKKKIHKYNKLKSNSFKNMNPKMSSKNTNDSPENSITPISGNNNEQQNNIYPTDIQGLFERLGII